MTTAKPKVSRLARIVAEFFYCGRFPIMPGTVGSLGSLVIWVPSVYCAWPLAVKLALLVIIFFVGVWASGHAIAYYKKSDPPQVVIDEVVGQGIPFLIASPNVWEIVLAVVLFRFFDILKPWPIKTLERRFQDRFGIMIDDVAAGIYAVLVLALCKYVFAI
jgi:phosphatidylglycerophosphatase A